MTTKKPTRPHHGYGISLLKLLLELKREIYVIIVELPMHVVGKEMGFQILMGIY